MDLLERYLFAVSQRLPRDMRADVTAELRSLLLDMIENKGSIEDEAFVAAILQEFGSPDKVAASYRPRDQYLIGPDFYPTYLLVVKIASGAISIAFLVTFVLSLVSNAQMWLDIGRVFLDIVPGYIQTLLAGLGSVTLVFVLLERYAPDTAVSLQEELAQQESDWDPRQLPPVENDNQLNRGDIIGELIATLFAMAFFNWLFYQNGTVIYDGQEWVSLPILTTAVYTVVLPLFNLVWISQIVFNIFLLRQKQWTRPTRWLDIGVKLLELVVVGVVLNNLPLLEIDWARLTAAGWSATDALVEGMTTLVPLFNTGIRIGLIVYAVVLALSIGKRVFNLLRPQEPSASEVIVA